MAQNYTARYIILKNAGGEYLIPYTDKQDQLVSGTNIKTLNNVSQLGTGNISVQATITGAATTITSSNLTANRALIANASGKVAVSSVTSTELGYLSGVTSSIQAQLNEKLSTTSGAASTIISSNLTASRALVSNASGKVAVSSVTGTELGYLSGVTSAIQTQLDNKVTKNANQTLTGIMTSQNNPWYCKNKNFASNNSTPSATTIVGGVFNQANDSSTLGGCYTQVETTGRVVTYVYARKKLDGTEKTSWFSVIQNIDGTACVTAPTPWSKEDNSTKVATTEWIRNHCATTAATTTSTASLNAPAYVVKNYQNGENWYRVWSDGWIEQGGAQTNSTSGSTSYTVSLLKAFATTDYTVMRAPVWGGSWGGAGSDRYTTGIFSKTITAFNYATHASGYVSKIMWYACGY